MERLPRYSTARKLSRKQFANILVIINVFLLSMLILLGIVAPLSATEGYLGAAILVVGLRPIMIWSSTPKDRFPLVEAFALTVAIYYGLPMLTGANGEFSARLISEPVRVEIGIALLFVVILLNLPIRIQRWRTHQKRTELRLPERYADVVMFLFLALGVMVFLVSNILGRGQYGVFAGSIETGITGLSAIGSYVLCRRVGEGRLTSKQRYFVYSLIAIAIIIQFASGLMAPAIRFMVPAIFGYIIGRGRVPWKFLFVFMMLFVFLSIGKAEMRDRFWGGATQAGTYDISSIQDRYAFWAERSWSLIFTDEERKQGRNNVLLKRLNLASILGILVERTPDSLPYVYGESYTSLVYMWIPRFVWPDKPIGHSDNIKLAIRYGILNKYTAKTTSIGLGILGEAYTNFGWSGVMVLTLLISVGLRTIQEMAGGTDALSFRGFIAASFLVASVNIESALSGILIPTIQALLVVFIVLRVLVIRKRLAIAGEMPS